MLHEIGIELQAKLRALGCPLPVIDGDDNDAALRSTTFGRERIVFQHDDGAGDSFARPKVQHQRPSHGFVRNVAAKLTIFVQSAKAGAQPFEHRRRAEHALDLVLVCLDEVVRGRDNTWSLNGGSFIRPEEFERTEHGGGAVYELKFSIDRGVAKQTWAYELAPTLTMPDGMIRTRTDVFGTDTEAPAEVACGGM